ncbi:MAG TPA: phosphoglucosamine mutase [Anaerohalosphaeraceae bacterium]|jgi:phosphomannomutase|nr:phosphoglucosamine mutase [Anaerohalosphaeraceae bacterium]HRT50042.1 phosphoglucosamine mutase [Anaerohalosphaeraceae bacterium]HRT85845.1 phosphoglucosamine mutase [Anaerohalosphaeraceae bacterium]
MARELIISISGMRGIIGENLYPEIAAAYAGAFGTFLRQSGRAQGQEGPLSVCVGRDSRPSGAMLFSAVAAGLSAVGVDVVDLGIVTTPGVGIMLRHLGCAGGVVITASHNPIEYNGLKLLLGNGIAPPKPLAEEIRSIYFDMELERADSLSCGRIAASDQTDEVHIEKVMAIVEPELIRAKRYKIVLDSVNGAGGRVGIRLLRQLGCEVVAVNAEPTGLFAHKPEPTAENLTDLCKQVKKCEAAAGFAQDPDGDRLAIVDENGRYIGEEYTLAFAARHVFSHGSGKAAANLSTSRMIDDIAQAAGGKVIRTPVGEANVAEAMIKNACVIGGEGNGGVIDLRVGPIRDSLVAMALTLQLMAETGKTVGQLADEIGGYHMVKTKFAADPQQAQCIIERFGQRYADAAVDRSDGCRFDFADGWVHLRTSNTEPIMRAIVETRTPEASAAYIDAVNAISKEVLQSPGR